MAEQMAEQNDVVIVFDGQQDAWPDRLEDVEVEDDEDDGDD